MANGWSFAVGNLAQRAPLAPVASLSSVEDPLYPLTDLGDGHTDVAARWDWHTNGVYAADFDLNLLEDSSDRSEAPTGWSDLELYQAGTPGLNVNAPSYGTFGGRSGALRVYAPSFQDITMMPEEDAEIKVGIYRPSASTISRVWVRIVDLWTGLKYDATAAAWNSSSTDVASQAVVDTWLDVSVSIPADPLRRERASYRVIVGADAATFDATSYFYASGILQSGTAGGNPGFFGAVDLVAIFGHNIPFGATVSLSENGGEAGPTIPVAPWDVPTFFGQNGSDALYRYWRLEIAMDADLLVTHDRPYIGELWIGRLQAMTGCPVFPFDVVQVDLGQERLIGATGHVAAWSQGGRANSRAKLRFEGNDASYKQARDVMNAATRYGVDPIVLAPNITVEGDRVFHGRLDNETTYVRVNNSTRKFDIDFLESPFPKIRGG